MKITPEHDKALLQEIAARKESLWRRGKLRWKLKGKQIDIYNTLNSLPQSTRKRVILCARGFGKTYMALNAAIESCLKPPYNHPVFFIAPEIKQGVDIATPIIQQITADAPPGLIKRLKSENKWQIGESQLILSGFNRDSIDRLRGQRPKAVFLDEVRDVETDNFKYGLLGVILPMCLHTLAPVNMMTTLPYNSEHYLISDVIPEAQLDNAFFKYTIYDNPLITEEQIEIAIKESGGINSPAFLSEYLCQGVRDYARAIVPEFDEQRHVRNSFDIPEYAHWLVSVDTGGVRDKTHAIIAYYDFIRARLCVVGERVFGPGTPTSEIVSGTLDLEREFNHKNKEDRIVDAHGQTMVDLNTMHSFRARNPLKDDFDAKINTLQVAFQHDKIEVHSDCKFLITTLRNGRLNEKRNDYERTESLGHCDAIDSLAYCWRNIRRDNPEPPRFHDPRSEWQRPSNRPVPHLTKVANSIIPRQFKR
jgi:hypothetical protein